ncbi:hypothetical protein BH10ACI3_BH10ACI3_22800 [soil metagenome]
MDPDEVRRLYIEEKLPIRAIAKRLNVSSSGVEHRLHADGVQLRPNVMPMELDREAVYYLYVVQGLKVNQVAKRLGVSFGVVNHEIDRYGFRRSEAPKHADRETLIKFYIDAKLTAAKAAQRIGLSTSRFHAELRRIKITHRHTRSCVRSTTPCDPNSPQAYLRTGPTRASASYAEAAPKKKTPPTPPTPPTR